MSPEKNLELHLESQTWPKSPILQRQRSSSLDHENGQELTNTLMAQLRAKVYDYQQGDSSD